jgi:hypothetical protein
MKHGVSTGDLFSLILFKAWLLPSVSCLSRVLENSQSYTVTMASPAWPCSPDPCSVHLDVCLLLVPAPLPSFIDAVTVTCSSVLFYLVLFHLISVVLFHSPLDPPAVFSPNVMSLLYGVSSPLYLLKYFKHTYLSVPLKLSYFLGFQVCNLSLFITSAIFSAGSELSAHPSEDTAHCGRLQGTPAYDPRGHQLYSLMAPVSPWCHFLAFSFDTQVHACTSVQVCTYACMYMYICVYVHVCIWMHMCAGKYPCARVCLCVYTCPNVCVCMHTCICACICTRVSMCTCVFTHLHECMCAYPCTRVHMCT